jgi:hypothetical protein
MWIDGTAFVFGDPKIEKQKDQDEKIEAACVAQAV